MLRKLVSSFSVPGVFLGLLLLCASLTPSLLPRVPATQGALSGTAFAIGYGLGIALHWTWLFLGFGHMPDRPKRFLIGMLAVFLAMLTILTFSRNTVWQNSIRQKMDMADVATTYPWTVAGIAAFIALFLIFAVRGIVQSARLTSKPLSQILPYRTAVGLGVVIVLVVLEGIVSGFIVQQTLRAADAFFATLDEIADDEVVAPSHAFASGGPQSVIAWDDIGARGQQFLTNGPGRNEIAAFTGKDALEPIRVYAGYRSGESFEERAAIALQDLIRLGGFERSVLIVATPTGTGWLDPAAVEPVAYMHGGDLAFVATQYTYVPSWLSLLVEPDRSRLAAQALFDAVYDHWTAMPDDDRPQLYLFGLSLGAMGSEASADLVSIFTDPIDGALWSGPPFASTIWASVTAGRNEGTPSRLPEFRDGSLVRFMNQDGIATPDGAEWGPMRLLYLQYASDPMVFFSPRLAFSRPDWLGQDRARDVSEFFDWYPLVTFLQVGFDIPMATSTPSGYGHTYDALDYIEGWIAVTQPDGWTEEDTGLLNELFSGFQPSPL